MAHFSHSWVPSFYLYSTKRFIYLGNVFHKATSFYYYYSFFVYRARTQCSKGTGQHCQKSEPHIQETQARRRRWLQHRGASWRWRLCGALSWKGACTELPSYPHEYCEYGQELKAFQILTPVLSHLHPTRSIAEMNFTPTNSHNQPRLISKWTGASETHPNMSKVNNGNWHVPPQVELDYSSL